MDVIKTPANEAAQVSEVEAMAAREATELPPEAHLGASPIEVATRGPDQMRFGRWVIWFILVLLVMSVVQTLKW